MATLTVKSFSCIKEASIEVRTLTMLIGPQASGKSVLSKLMYFFVDLLSYQYSALEDGASLDAFSERVKKRFIEWFPISAWGSGKFSVIFSAGQYEVRISRNAYNKEINDNIRLYLSPFFKEQYSSLLKEFGKKPNSADRSEISREFAKRYQLRRISEKMLTDALGDDYFGNQLFIPAGRAFFTSLGRGILAFEQAQVLDPVTIQFGRLMASSRDFGSSFAFLGSEQASQAKRFEGLIGGALHFESDRAFVLTEDGRKVPYSALSSGQQELLPLLTALSMSSLVRVATERGLLYIEEPEAHLFPTAQIELTSMLCEFILARRRNTSLLITTHSPYVLARLNTLLKAGSLAHGGAKSRRQRLASVVPASEWIRPSQVSAYALVDGRAQKILGDDGLIDGEYLDSVSGVISQQFDQLLEIEHGE